MKYDDILIADCETDGLLYGDVLGRSVATKIHCIAIQGLNQKDPPEVYADALGYPPLAEGLARLRPARRVVMHNGLGFDLFAINKFYPGTLRFEQVLDTLILSRMADPESRSHSLEALGVKLNHPKVQHDDWTKFSTEMAIRCREDVTLTRKVFRMLTSKSFIEGKYGVNGKLPMDAINREHKVQLVIALQEQAGFPLNVKRAEDLEGTLRQEQADLRSQLDEVFPPVWTPLGGKQGKTVLFSQLLKNVPTVTPKIGGIRKKSGELDTRDTVKGCPYTRVAYTPLNPGSRQMVASRLRMKGWRPTKFTNNGQPKVNEEVLSDLAVLMPEMAGLSRYFRLGKMLGQLSDGDNAWLKLVVKENGVDVVHGRVNTIGCITQRMSHFGPNLAQVDKKDKRMRAVWASPRPDLKMVGVDADAIEACFLGHYLQPYDAGAFIKTVTEGSKKDGTDLHTRNLKAVRMYKRDEGTSIKNLFYGYLYGAGNAKLGLTVIADAQEVEKYNKEDSPWLFNPKTGKRLAPTTIGKNAREALEANITGLKPLKKRLSKLVAQQGWIRGLDGRRITVKSEHAALNSLLQSAGAILMKEALAYYHFDILPPLGYAAGDFMETNHFTYAANVHDEVQLLAEEDSAEILGGLFADAITASGTRLGVRCPLAASASVGDDWSETH